MAKPMPLPHVNFHHALCGYMLVLMMTMIYNGKLPEGSLPVADATSSAQDTAGSFPVPLTPSEHDLQLQLHSKNNYRKASDFDMPSMSGSASDDGDDNIIVVATIDGTFYGISQTDGQIKWKSQTLSHSPSLSPTSDATTTNPNTFKHSESSKGEDKDKVNDKDKDADSNTNALFNPLLSTTTTRSNNKTWRTAAVPSLDGRVYLTLGSSNINSIQHQEAQETVTNSVKDLVERAPFMDSRGRFFVSSKRAFAVALDKNSGQVLRVVKAGEGFASAFDDSNENVNVFDMGEDAGLVWVGRVDYEVTVHDARTGEVDVQFSTSEVLSVQDMIQETSSEVEHAPQGHSHGHSSGRKDAVGKPFKNGLNLKEPILSLPTKSSTPQSVQEDGSIAEIFPGSLSQPADLNPPPTLENLDSNIFSTPGGRLALRDPDSGMIQWVSHDIFDSPVAFALESSTGSSLGVHIVQDAPMPHLFSPEYIQNEIEREIKILSDGNGNHDSDGTSGDHLGSNHDETVFGALENGELFAVPLGRRGFQHGYGYAYSHGRNGLPRVPRLSSTVGGSMKNKNAQLLAKIPPVKHGDWQHGIHSEKVDPSGSMGTALAIPQHCNQNSKNFPQCLNELYGDNMQQFLLEQQQQGNDMHDFVQLPPLHNNGGKAKDQFRAVLTSWIPPAVALAFVVSFELGRRERARSEAAKTRKMASEKDFQASTESVTFQRELSDEDLLNPIEKPGAILVSEEVLGFGGHGTVVYKGKLDGRFVAVKRMLKAYTASADREISLLIESDGHPNVVRYFLKEIRGDFVYLALELCDLNLQDLIVSLSKYNMKQAISRQQENLPVMASSVGVNHALKKTLFEIASGIKHIHSLRIVHRDLKPANILLAKKSRRRSKQNSDSEDDAVYEAFQAEMYIPKISDMGLGKQLAGQSSFGFSTFNTSLGAGLSGNQASTIAGVGPGSVGWQAPEVMAQRQSPEAASLDGSSGPESMLECSPADMSLNGRTSRSVDIFSLGCIFYCTLLPGSHPFGEWYEREANIMKNRPATDALKEMSVEAWDLVVSMLSRNPKARPTASQICQHPFFWSASHRLAFICEFSDRLESENEPNVGEFDRLLVERQASIIVGPQWDTKIDNDLLNNVQKFRTYDTSSVRDCLRLIRNKHHHFEELPLTFKSKVPNQKALLEYFELKFPSLLMHCYITCREYMYADDLFAVKYGIPCKPQAMPPQLNKIQNNGPIGKSIHHPSISNATVDNEADAAPILNDEGDSQLSKTLPQSMHSNRSHCSQEIISWQGSTTATELNCRGWIRSEDEWIQMTNEKIKKRDLNLMRCAEDPKYRTRLCNHWDLSQGTHCPMLKKNKCVFAHGPAELRVKEGKRKRWGRLVDVNGNNSNPQHSGGEDTYGAARQIENSRKVEGKWKANGNSNATPKKKNRSKNRKQNNANANA